MSVKEPNFIKKVIFLYLLSCIALAIIPFYFLSTGNALLVSAILIIVYTIITEAIFKALYKKVFKKPYQFIPKLPFKQMYVEPHPYLPYDYKKNFLCQKTMPAIFPLNQDKGYALPELKTNNFGYISGPGGGRDIAVPKPAGLVRVNCIGASETANYLSYNNKEYSYPGELEKILKNVFPKTNMEVNNCGQGGFTSAGILMKFLLRTIDTRPDIVVIYHAYNDLWPSLTEPYKSDYSHSKKSLGEAYHLYKAASIIPSIPLASWNFIVNNVFFSQNPRFSLLKVITKRRADIGNDFKGLSTYKRNIEHMINICKANGIRVILSTFCYYLYDGIKNDQKCLRYNEGIALANEEIKKLASRHDLPIVDNDSLIPRDDRYFMDSIHFTPEGMELFAKNISRPIVEHINAKQEKS